ncbi:MAG: [FeFe] hydrogenase, group A [Candidatus Delongbacteria bacterium]|nr:[FeFe] hydrogenase, group A [Candidatus Delongbacteria bacterium]
MSKTNTITIDNKTVPINGERNLLEVIRKADIEIPTFCYHSELSIYGACRLCLVEVEGRGLMASCSTPPEPGMKIRTTTNEIREIRKIAVELLLANHDQSCPTCGRSATCKLQDLARRLGITEVRFKPAWQKQKLDQSTPSLIRDPNKCILCGDCVRVCSEIQGIGAIDFAYRGAQIQVLPAFNKDLSKVECVYCGQCAAVCPTGAITPRSEVEGVWNAINNPKKVVVAQIAPAVRVALGEMFGETPGSVSIGKIVSALKQIGFDKVYDTSFAADLTVIEEANEFIRRKTAGEKLPQFTSCCPAWIKFAEQYYPSLLPNLSSCKSPQQMFGSLVKEMLPEKLNTTKENLVVVSIMPCTAKKFEAQRPEFTHDGIREVDYVLTTQELGRMIQEAGIKFNKCLPESLDLPFGFKTGAGVIFGTSGGVTEAVLRYASEKLTGIKSDNYDYEDIRGHDGIRTTKVNLNGIELKLAVVHSLKNARYMAEQVKNGQCEYDLIEIMACPGGCVSGAGQPIVVDAEAKKMRSQGLYEADKMLQVHKSQENPYVTECYNQKLGEANSPCAHHLLHTQYQSRRRITEDGLPLVTGTDENKLDVAVCVGTNCYLKGSQDILHALIHYIEERQLQDVVDVKATFCFERCSRGPTVSIGDSIMEKCTYEKACEVLNAELAKLKK